MLRAAELEIAIVFEYREIKQPEFERMYEGIELHHARGRPDVPRAAAQPPARRASRGCVCGRRRRDLDPGERRAQLVRPAPDRVPAAGFQPKVGFQSDDYNVVQGLIAAGVGISLLRARADERARGHRRALARKRRAGAQDRAATLAGRYRSPATEAMLEILAEVAAGFELPAGCGDRRLDGRHLAAATRARRD